MWNLGSVVKTQIFEAAISGSNVDLIDFSFLSLLPLSQFFPSLFSPLSLFLTNIIPSSFSPLSFQILETWFLHVIYVSPPPPLPKNGQCWLHDNLWAAIILIETTWFTNRTRVVLIIFHIVMAQATPGISSRFLWSSNLFYVWTNIFNGSADFDFKNDTLSSGAGNDDKVNWKMKSEPWWEDKEFKFSIQKKPNKMWWCSS